MKKVFLLSLILITTKILYAQSAGINFQGLARDPLGEILASQQLNLKFSIIASTPTGAADYIETRNVRTNELGVFSIVIGDTGAVSSNGVFSNIDWKRYPKYLKVEMLQNSNNTYITLGITQLQSVPYANFANYANSMDASNLSGVVPISHGGTGLTSSGTNGQFLTSTGSGTFTWTTASGGGIPYNGATQAVDLGAYDLKVNGITIGIGAGQVSTNTAFGYTALSSNTLGVRNVSIGNAALKFNTTGQENIAIGHYALLSNTTGGFNTATGKESMSMNTTGGSNTAYGVNSLFANTTGNTNTTIGGNSLQNNTTGSNNTAIGYGGLVTNITGTNLTGIGKGADVTTDGLTNATSLGFGALVGASNTIQLGNTSVTSINTSGKLTTGSVTYPNSHGANGQILTTTGTGTLTWTNIANHAIGESYGGGIVFYVYDGGKHGLIAARTDQSSGIRWYGGSLTNTKAKADGIGAGLKNTSIIIANQGDVDGNEFAATLCNQYSVTETTDNITTTYGDWYLPSWYELNLLYTSKSIVGGFSNVYYWSSSENFSGLAKAIDFGTGTRTDGAWKYETFRVRAIRAF
jgi:hypothetical protein